MASGLFKPLLAAGRAVLEAGVNLDELALSAEAYSEVLVKVLSGNTLTVYQAEEVLALHQAVEATVAVAAARAGRIANPPVRKRALKAYLANRERGG